MNEQTNDAKHNIQDEKVQVESRAEVETFPASV